MDGIYSFKRYGDTEDDDEELAMPPNHGSKKMSSVRTRGFASGKRVKYDDVVAGVEEEIDKAASKMSSSGSNSAHSSLSPWMITCGPNDEEIARDDTIPPVSAIVPHSTPASSATVPHSTPRAPQNDIRPGAFHENGRNARDVTDAWSTSVQPDGSVNGQSHLDVLVSAEAVDPNETQRIVERELEEQRRKAPVAEVVRGYWCSPRVKRMSLVVVLLVIVAIVLGTVLPRVLEPPEPTPEPTAAPTPPGPYLEGVLSSISPDGGEALQTASTPQNKSLNWLLNNTYLDTYPLDKKIQRYVLATLYYSTNGHNWKRNTLWLSDDDECGWYNEAKASFCIDSEIVDLDLFDDRTGNNLVGTIPNEISLLSNSLEALNLADNTLMGRMPSEIGELSKLNALSLWNNSITGTLPSEIASLASLTWVNLRVNGLTGTIVSEIGLLTNLKVLSFSVNKFTGTIPSEIGSSKHLESLFLYSNELTGTIPSEINSLTNLSNLYLYDNDLTGDYTCPNYVSDCRISCSNNTDQCRSLGTGPADPSSSSPSEVTSTTSPSIPPSTVGTADSPTKLPTETPSSVPSSTPVQSLNPSSTPPSVVDTASPTVPTTPHRPTFPPSTTRPPTPRPTSFETEPPPTLHPPTDRPTTSPTSRPTTPAPTNFSTKQPTAICGDGKIDAPEEECELNYGEPCPTGQYCDESCKCVEGCGNGRLDEGEECDPTAVPTGCEVNGFYCNPFCACSPGLPTNNCGNGILDVDEECEPGEPQYACPNDGLYCDSTSCKCIGCGNGRIDDDEKCDYEAKPTGCPYGEFCSRNCECYAAIPRPKCGNGDLDDEEECEPGVPQHACPAGQICDGFCRCTACGNGRIDDGEECDYAAEPTGCGEVGQICDDFCTCTGTTCGDGEIDDGEECDYMVDPTGCSEADGYYCDSNCECIFDSSMLCGNGVFDEEFGEECEPGIPPHCPDDDQICDDLFCICTTCGNGRIDYSEECDYKAEPTGCDEGEYCDSYFDLCTCVPW